MLHVDGLSNASGARVGLILIGPEGDVVGYALRFEFPATNNEIEYEALLARLKGGTRSGSPASKGLQ